MLATKKVDFSADVFKAILIKTTFAFNKDTHATLADVTASQIATGFGYTQNDKILAGISVIEDDTNDRCTITWTNPTWTATGGDIGPFGALIIYDDTTTDDTVVFCADFGTDYTIPNGSSFQPQNVSMNI
jgi:hypothetical protein